MYLFRVITISILLFLSCFNLFSQGELDTLDNHLPLSELRLYDVHHYDLNIEVDINQKSIKGSNKISFTVDKPTPSIQIDLFDEYNIVKVSMDGNELKYVRAQNHFIVSFLKPCVANQNYQINIEYSGVPPIAKNPPWDGGFTWSKDSLGNPWIATSCQGLGASSWWPNKDHVSDRADSLDIRISIPESYSSLYAVSNGELKSVDEHHKHLVFHWHTSYPINNYNVTLNIGNYAHFERRNYNKNTHKSLKMDFYVLKSNKNRAKNHFIQAYEMLTCYEHFFGPYPFWNDGYGLVEAPFWGMEHQGAIAYGNNYILNDYGFDFILIHESAHEYWGNSLGCKDNGELWIHEAFATYSESLFVEWKNGKDAANKYLIEQRTKIKNTEPLIGPLNVNYSDYKTTDMYYKGAWALHSVRNIVDNDSIWFRFIKNLSVDYRSKQVSSVELLELVKKQLGQPSFEFLKHNIYNQDIPVLEYSIKKGKKIKLRFTNVNNTFEMPITINCETGSRKLSVTNEWTELKSNDDKIIGLDIDNYLIDAITP